MLGRPDSTELGRRSRERIQPLGTELVERACSTSSVTSGWIRSLERRPSSVLSARPSMNSYTPAGFERTITELAEPAFAREIPPSDRPAIPAGFDKATALFREIGMHPVQEPDLLREGR